MIKVLELMESMKLKNAFGLGKDIKDIELIKNTDICEVMCSATDIITLYEKGSLVDDARFSEDVISYEFKYRKLGSNVWKDYEVGQIVEEGTYELYSNFRQLEILFYSMIKRSSERGFERRMQATQIQQKEISYAGEADNKPSGIRGKLGKFLEVNKNV